MSFSQTTEALKRNAILKYLNVFIDAVYITTVFFIDVLILYLNCALAILESLFRVIIKPSKKSLAGEVVLITGGGRGLGREMALEFARRGVDKVVLLDINLEGCMETAAQVRKEGKKAHAYYCDVTNQEAVNCLAQQIAEEVGHISILVNNAGIMTSKPFTQQKPKDIRRLMDVNTMSHFWLLQEYLPKMMKNGKGHIVSVSSIAGRIATSNLIPYVTSKFAVTGLMESLQEEFRQTKSFSDIHFSTAFPSIMDTGLCKRPKLNSKYPFHQLISCDIAAKRIIDGIQRNEEHIYIPAKFEYLYRLSHMFPRRVQQLGSDFLDIGVHPDVD